MNLSVRRMRILAVSQSFPLPPRTGSAIVAANTLRELSQRHDVTLLTGFAGSPDLLRDWGISSFHFASERPRRTSRLRTALGYIGKRSALECLLDRLLKRLVSEVLKGSKYDAILVFGYWDVRLIPRAARGMTIANIEDPPSIKFRRLSNLEGIPKSLRIRSALESIYYTHHERQLLDPLHAVFLLSEEDLKDYSSATGLKNLRFSNYAVDKPEPIPKPFPLRDSGVIAISGNMFHPPNEAGVIHFIRVIFPMIVSKFPDARLRLIGASPTTRILGEVKAFGERITVTGQVPSVASELQRAVVSVCPIRLRIGVQTKILEAMRVGTPVVSWPEGNSGVRGVPGKDLAVARDDESFAEETVRLLLGTNWGIMVNNGLSLISRSFSWSTATRAIEAACEELSEARQDQGNG